MRFGGKGADRPRPQGQRTGERARPAEVKPQKPAEGDPATGVTHESEVQFDPDAGHVHNGTDSARVSHSDLEPASVTPDQHHAQAHDLFGGDHDTSGAPSDGDLVYRSTTWQRLAIGTADYFLRVVGGFPAWVQLAFSMITGTITDAQHGALSTSSTHGLGGDVTGTTAAAVVGKVQGKAVAIPTTPTDDSKFLQFDGTSLIWTPQTSGAPTNATYVTLSADGTLSNEAVLGSAVIMSGLASARPAAATAGRLYFETDTNGGTLFRDTGAAWVQQAPGVTAAPQSHSLTGHSLSGSAAGHILVASSSSAYALEAPGTRVILSGTAAARPAASIAGRLYFATDTNGGTLYRDSGSGWVQLAHGLTEAPVSHALSAHSLSGSTAGFILVATSATAYALEAPGTRVVQAAAGTPVSTTPDGTLYWDTTNLKLYRSSGAGVWVLVSAMSLLAASLAGATDGHLMMATGATTYNLEALTSRVSKSASGSPNGSVTGIAGAFYLNTADSTLWRCTTGTTWVQVTGGGAAGTTHNLLDGSVHPDTLAGTPVAADLIVANSTPKWARFAKGATNTFLKTNSFGSLQWVSPAFSELLGSITDAQHGALTAASSHTMGGDVTGTTAASVVEKVRGKNVPAPTGSEDHKGLAYDFATTAWVYRFRSLPVVGWSRNNISGIATTDAEMPHVGGGGTNINAPFIPPYDGIITGISLATENGGTVGTGTYTITVYKNGVATSATVGVTGTNKVSLGHFSVAFSQDDELKIYDKRTGTLAARDVQATLFIAWSE